MPQARKRILVIGSVNADIIVEIDRMPARGETVSTPRDDTGRFSPGGKGNNQAAAVGKIIGTNHPSLCAIFAGQFGNDTHGKVLESALQRCGVETTLAGHPICPSGQAFVFVYPDGDNSIVIVGGANRTWPEQLPTALTDAIKSAAIVLLQCEIPSRVNSIIAKIAAEANVPIMWDTGGDDVSIPSDILPLLTYVCPNETELSRLTKREINNMDDAIAAAQYLQELGAKNVIVTLGSEGSVFVPVDNPNIVRQKCFKIEKVVDTTGAGDCYRGAFAVALVEGRQVQECLIRASAASALCVQRVGALPSMPTGDEVLAFLRLLGLES